jgi:hypothetical protein
MNQLNTITPATDVCGQLAARATWTYGSGLSVAKKVWAANKQARLHAVAANADVPTSSVKTIMSATPAPPPRVALR